MSFVNLLQNQLIPFLIGVVAGFVLGLAYAYFIEFKRQFNINTKTYLVLSVSFIWAITVLVSLVDRTYEVPYAIHTLLGGIVGSLFGEDIFKKGAK